MGGDSRAEADRNKLSRRSFVRAGGATLAGGLAAAAVGSPSNLSGESTRQGPHIRSYKTLGRTGWRVSDIGFGTGPLREPGLVRAAFDRGINYFDTAESYCNGSAERTIG